MSQTRVSLDSGTLRTVIDLFSGAGGMSYGFHAHPAFQAIAAADAQIGKPSSGSGSLECNSTFEANLGFRPVAIDLSQVSARELIFALFGQFPKQISVLCACPPCTGFSRTQARNHLIDDPRNSLVERLASFVDALKPEIFLLENSRELLMGNFRHHWLALKTQLESLGYCVDGRIHRLDQFGLPQKRERAIVIAVRSPLSLRTLDELWSGVRVREEALTVRRAIARLVSLEAGERDPRDRNHVSPAINELTFRRLAAIPRDGGSWADLRSDRYAEKLLTPAMKRSLASNRLGSFPDVYGRLWWDRPAVTIKRECSHTGNGRYAHPEQNRLCSVREMAILQGFPLHYQFTATRLANNYRHVGDAVPPLISYQLAWLCHWILTGSKPQPEQLILPHTHLQVEDLQVVSCQPQSFAQMALF